MRRLSTLAVYNLCNDKGWFTRGDNSQYERMFDMVRNAVRNLVSAIRLSSSSRMETISMIANYSTRVGAILCPNATKNMGRSKLSEKFHTADRHIISVLIAERAGGGIRNLWNLPHSNQTKFLTRISFRSLIKEHPYLAGAAGP